MADVESAPVGTDKRPIQAEKDEEFVEQVDKPVYLDNGLTDEENIFLQAFPEDRKRKAIRKVDVRLVPLLCLFYLLSFIDRANIGMSHPSVTWPPCVYFLALAIIHH
jgi:hypothetical protein